MVEHRRARHKLTRQKLREDYESTLFQKSGDVDTVVGESNEGFICLLRNGCAEQDRRACHRIQLSQKCKSEYAVNHHL